MIDFAAVREKRAKLGELVANLGPSELHELTDEMINAMLEILEDAQDADVTFQPVDPAAKDNYATNPDEESMPWTLGHVVVHATASSEESAALSSVLARGLENKDRSRYEVPWRDVSTVAQLRQRLEESRRMRHAFLETWPDQPHYEVLFTPPWPGADPVNAVGRFVFGLYHDSSHLEQMREIMRQAKAAR